MVGGTWIAQRVLVGEQIGRDYARGAGGCAGGAREGGLRRGGEGGLLGGGDIVWPGSHVQCGLGDVLQIE